MTAKNYLTLKIKIISLNNNSSNYLKIKFNNK